MTWHLHCQQCSWRVQGDSGDCVVALLVRCSAGAREPMRKDGVRVLMYVYSKGVAGDMWI